MSRLLDRRNARKVNVNGLRRDPRTGAGKLAKSERGYGGVLALDFTDNSAAVYDPTTQANVAYTQGLTDGNGNFRGVSSLLTYTSPSNKLALQSDGFIKYQAHNLLTYSEDTSNFGYVVTNMTKSGTDTLLETTANASHRVRRNPTTLLGDEVFAIDIQSVSRPYGAVYFSGGGTAGHVAYDLSIPDIGNTTTGGYGADLSGSSTIADQGGGWYRITIPVTSAQAGVTSIEIYVMESLTLGGANVSSYVGDVAKGIKIRKLHIYRSPANTDYIATTSDAKYALPLEYDTSGNCLGLLVEEARTNLCLYSNDLTQAGSWTASNMTTAKTATGPDNVANSATTITASAGNATILQAITSASAARVTSVYIKRRTGTGNIDLTQDNGSTWTTQAVDSTWTRFSLSSVTSANPTVGIRIVTSGDAVDVALFSHEVGAFVTSPIVTYGATATRAADNISIATSAFPLGAEHSLYADYEINSVGYAGVFAATDLSDNTSNERISLTRNANPAHVAIFGVVDGGAEQLATTSINIDASDLRLKQAIGVASNDAAYVVNGGTVTSDVSVTLPTMTRLDIGSRRSSFGHLTGHIKGISYVPRRKSDAELQAETT